MESAQLDASSVASRLALARALLQPKSKVEPAWPVVASAAFFMVCALGFAVAALSAPEQHFTPVAERTRN